VAVLTRAAILAASDLKTKVVKVPEWKGEVTIREWSVAESEAIAMLSIKADGGFIEKFRENVVRLSVIDPETGELLFTEDDLNDLGKKSPAAMARVHKAAMALNSVAGVEDEDGESPNV
jgi:hypothetical protein